MSIALKQGILSVVGEEQLDVAATSVGFTSSELTSRVVMASCRLETAQIRMNVNGATEAPTAGGSEGSHLVEVGEIFEVWGSSDLNSARFIRTGSTSGDLQVMYFGTGS
jgi:hypothetical protein